MGRFESESDLNEGDDAESKAKTKESAERGEKLNRSHSNASLQFWIGCTYLIIVGDAGDAVSVNFTAPCKFSRLNAKIYHFTACVQ